MESPVNSPAAGAPNQACPYCRESIHAEAKKCRHCGELLRKPAPAIVPKALKQVGTYIGLGTGLLSLLYALREGYYFVRQRQEQRIAVSSYAAAADRFVALDNLEYAEDALRAALAIEPNDLGLARRLFHLSSLAVVREAESVPLSGESKEIQEKVQGQVLEGFRLLSAPLSRAERAGVLVMLGRLLRQDVNWSDEARIGDLFKEGYELASNDAEPAFQYGCWLQCSDERKGGGPRLSETRRANPVGANPNR